MSTLLRIASAGSLGIFLIWPAFLLFIRYRRPNRLSWPRLIAAIAILGWGRWVLHICLYNEYLDYMVRVLDNPDHSAQLAHDWEVDGARNVFAAFFGWAISLVYSIPWLGVYGVIALVRMVIWSDQKRPSEHSGP